MSIFRNRILVKIIATLCIVLTIFNFGISNAVYAADWGGILITPITKLLTSIADGIIAIIHQAVQNQEISIIEISGTPNAWDQWGKHVVTALITVAVVIIAAASIIASAGGTAPLIAGGTAAVAAGLKIVKYAAIAVVLAGAIHTVTVYLWDDTPAELLAETLGDWWFPVGNLYMPAFSVTPEEIFSDQIALLDVNFFAKESKYIYVQPKKYSIQQMDNWLKDEYIEGPYESRLEKSHYKYEEFGEAIHEIVATGKSLMSLKEAIKYIYPDGTEHGKSIKAICEIINEHAGEALVPIEDEETSWKVGLASYDREYDHENGCYEYDYNEALLFYDDEGTWVFTVRYEKKNKQTETEPASGANSAVYRWEHYENLYVNINTNKGYISSSTIGVEEVQQDSTAQQLKGVISKWYFTLRNLAILVLMLVLIYIGIRIVIGSTAGQKAKYKERLQDWLVAMCLLFIMHYIMVFAIEVVGKITTLIATVGDGKGIIEYVPLQEEHINNIEDMEKESTQSPAKTEEFKMFETLGNIVQDENGKTYLGWITNIMGRMRIMAQTTAEGTARWVGYALCYIVLVIETLFFLWTYLKRVLYMAFLTMIAPLVAMTYPIDKITDGKAQAFDAWLKEYIFNLLIQPLHLLLYTILVSSAFNLAITNPIYAIVAVGFMMPAENLMRKFFGFTKAQTPGALGGAAGAALAFTGMQKIMNLGKGKKGGSKDDKNEKKDSKIRFAKSDGVNAKDTVANKVQGKDKSAGADAGASGGKGAGGGATSTAAQNDTEKAQAEAEKIRMNTNNQHTEGGAQKPAESTQTGTKAASGKEKDTKQDSKKGKRHVIKAAVGAGRRYHRMLGKKMANRIHKMRPIRAIARGAAGLAGATAFGMAGLALGVASGDASKAFQYASTGAVGGYAAGKGVAGKTVDAMTVNKDKIKNEMEMAYWGEDYKKFKFDESVDKMSKDEGNIDTIRQLTGLSYDDSQEMLQTVGRSCYESGITNMEDIAAVYEMEKQGNTREEAIAALKFNQYLPSDLNKMGEDDRSDHINRWAREYEEAGYENPEILAQESMKLAEKINKIKSGLKKA